MEKPCPGCQKPVEISKEATSSDCKQLVCPSCGDILWLNKDGVLKSVSKEYRDMEQRELELESLSVERERCVMTNCDKETPYTRDTPITKREHYVRGVGQLCQECHVKYYPEGGD